MCDIEHIILLLFSSLWGRRSNNVTTMSQYIFKYSGKQQMSFIKSLLHASFMLQTLNVTFEILTMIHEAGTIIVSL